MPKRSSKKAMEWAGASVANPLWLAAAERQGPDAFDEIEDIEEVEEEVSSPSRVRASMECAWEYCLHIRVSTHLSRGLCPTSF